MVESFFIFYLKMILIVLCVNNSSSLGSFTDFFMCKLSHLGLEYRGNIKKTESGVPCQAWDTDKPIHKVDESYTDDKFSDFSKKDAKNYCRNPSLHPDGPWCYTLNANNVNETCMVPLCLFSECRTTGPGIEYSGIHNKGLSDRKCLKWDKDRKNVKYKGNITQVLKYTPHKFPENDLSDAKKYCRNPSGDLGGPWCFVEVEGVNEVEKEYCDIPFCEEQECTVFTKNVPIYSHYSVFDPMLNNFTFGLRLWDSDSFLNANVKLALTVLALPVTGQEIRDLGIGIEIFVSTTKTALTYGNKDAIYYEKLEEALVSDKYLFFSLEWNKGIITLTREGDIKPIFIAEIKRKNNLVGFYENSFLYYSAIGENIQWSFPFCDDDDICDVHITTSEYHQQFWPLGKTDLGFELKFYVRSFHSGYILLVSSPAVEYPAIKIMLDKSDGFTEVIYYAYENAPPNTLIRHSLNELLLDYWKWAEFSLTVFSDSLQIFNTRDIGTLLIIDVRHEALKQIRWFSPASKDTTAHWTFFCTPPKPSYPPPALLPECALDDNEKNYEGTQDLTNSGKPCLPWSGKDIQSGDLFDDKKDAIKAKNYCRSFKNEDIGSFCYTFSSERKFEKTYCHVRKCKSEECRLAGTGNDYVGKVNVTRSNRTCMTWIDTFMKGHINESLFADKKIEDAKNYCRNPTRNIAGSWCYTNDSKFKYDICNIRDCDKPEECIVIIRKKGIASDIHILPQWKEEGTHGGLHFSAKQWNPDQQIGIVFEFKSFEKDQSMKLVIGEEENEKVQMYYNSYLVKEKTLSHLVHSGKWSSFWLQVRKGEIALGYEDVNTALFEWTHDNKESAFEPVFISYMSLFLSPLGLFFNCDECHIENTTNVDFLKLFPMGLRRKEKNVMFNDISFKLRGTGDFNLLISALPDAGFYHLIAINNSFVTLSKIDFTQFTKVKVLKSEKLDKSPLLTANSWTKVNFSFNENHLNITSGKKSLMYFHSDDPLVFYWFSVGVEKGWIVWVANCDPVDIDGPPLDGGWSKWSSWKCTVTCGGGEGFRTRNCSNPSPNIFGQLCHGSSKSVGTCNNFPCGDISPETMELIQNSLRKTNISLIANEGDSVLIENNYELISKITKESPDASHKWTLNGITLGEDGNRKTFENKSVNIKQVSKNDVGVYAYVLNRINKQKIIIHVITLAVVSKQFDVSTRATRQLSLHSKAVTLGHIFTDLSQKWLLNGNIYVDYGITTLAAVALEQIKPVNSSHSGEWKCVVEQMELNLIWVTNIVNVEVKKAPNFYIHLMEDNVTAPIFSKFKTEADIKKAIVFFVIMVFLSVSVCVLIYVLLKKKKPVKDKRKKSKYKRNRRLK